MTDDLARALKLVGQLGPESPRGQVCVIEGDPPSKARARFGNGHTYTPKVTVLGEKRIAEHLKVMEPFDANVAVVCLFYRRTRGRVDVDNLMKAVLDGATKAKLWRDDSQVTALLGILEHDPKNPRTIVACAEHVSSMDRGDRSVTSVCERCGEAFTWTPAPSQKARKYCTRGCAGKSRGQDLSALALCRNCGVEFRRRTAGQTLCSENCRIVHLVETRKAARRPAGRCRTCGAQTSRPEYLSCRACWCNRKGAA